MKEFFTLKDCDGPIYLVENGKPVPNVEVFGHERQIKLSTANGIIRERGIPVYWSNFGALKWNLEEFKIGEKVNKGYLVNAEPVEKESEERELLRAFIDKMLYENNVSMWGDLYDRAKKLLEKNEK
jgi:hypothetical protein